MEEAEVNSIQTSNKLISREKEQVVYFILSKDQIESNGSNEKVTHLQLESSKLMHHSQYFKDTLSMLSIIDISFYY